MSNITPKKKAMVYKLVKEGLTLRAACKKAKISYLPLINWRKLIPMEDEQTELYVALRIDLNWLHETQLIRV